MISLIPLKDKISFSWKGQCHAHQSVHRKPSRKKQYGQLKIKNDMSYCRRGNYANGDFYSCNKLLLEEKLNLDNHSVAIFSKLGKQQ